MLQTNAGQRHEQITTADALDYARKTYRYLRIAIVAMVVAMLIAVVIEYVKVGSLLGSLSAYYFTPVHAIFIGGMIMIGICLIAIRGTTDEEDIALNIAGLLAPIVAVVPTTAPTSYPNLLDAEDLLLPASRQNNLIALSISAVVAILIASGLSRALRDRARNRAAGGQTAVTSDSTVVGFVLALAAIAIIVVVWWAGSPETAHGVAAVGTILGLWFVATANAMAECTDSSGERTRSHQLKVGVVGSLFLVGVALSIGGLIRVFFTDTLATSDYFFLIAGLATLGVSFVWRDKVQQFFEPLKRGRGTRFWYLIVAMAMVTAGPFLYAWPDPFDQRTFWVELVELVPFGAFWIVQTVERWSGPSPMPDDPRSMVPLL